MLYNFVTKDLYAVTKSRNLTSSDNHLFPALEQSLGGHKFKDDSEVKIIVIPWQVTQNVDACREKTGKPYSQNNEPLNCGGDYVETECDSTVKSVQLNLNLWLLQVTINNPRYVQNKFVF